MGHRVLIAEDEPNIMESLCFILEHGGFEVLAVDDGKNVIEKVRQYAPSIIVLDVMLPNRNGFELLKALKSDRELATIPVLMLTAKGQQQDRATAFTLGADAFITKPFSNREVMARIETLTGGREGAKE